MKKIIIGLVLLGSPLFASAEETVSAADQAAIYLNAAEKIVQSVSRFCPKQSNEQ